MTISTEQEKATIYAPIGSPILASDDTQIIQADGWYKIVTPSVPDIALNEVTHSPIAADQAHAKIAETFETYDKHKLPFKWVMGPMSSPEHLEHRIAPLASDAWTFRGMAVPTDHKIKYSDQVQIESVTSANIEEFIKIFVQAWKLDAYASRTAAQLAKHATSTSHAFCIAKKDQTPIGIAGTIFKENYGYLVSAIVLEEFRGLGAYSAMTQFRLQQLQNKNFKFAVTQARETTSAPILEKLGFQTAFKANIYKFDAI